MRIYVLLHCILGIYLNISFCLLHMLHISVASIPCLHIQSITIKIF